MTAPTKSRIDTVMEAVLEGMKDNDIPDTTENRRSFLEGVLASWKEEPNPEDPAMRLDKALYVWSVQLEIIRLGLVAIPH